MSLSPFNLDNDVVELGPQTLVTSTWTNNVNDLTNLITEFLFYVFVINPIKPDAPE